ncbi:MAG: HPr family phosphocarrier protein [Rickettsiales bacterium]|nr:HPr family phosphocarrier protein [Rickettsiales bacterium]
MATALATICNKKGLHARAAAKLVKLAATFDARVEVIRLPRDGEAPDPQAKAGATSILSLLMLAAEKGVNIELHGSGNQAQEALDAIVALVGRRFDEEE